MGLVIGVPLPEIAYHEAGHAVMALRLRLPLHEVLVWEQRRLFKPPLGRGHTRLTKRDTYEPPPIKAALVFLAGPEAQAIYRHRTTGQPLRRARADTWRQNAAGDIAAYFTEAAAAPDEPWSRDIDGTQRRLRQMAAEDWPRIARLAEALQRRSRLTGREVRKVAA